MNPVFKSIRWRLQLWHGSILLVVLVAFNVTAWWLVRDNRIRRVDQRLQQHASALLDAMRPGDLFPPEGRPPERLRPFSPDFDRPGSRGWRPGPDRRESSGPGGPPWGERLVTAIAETGAGITAEGMYYRVWSPDGTLLHESGNAPLEALPSGVREAGASPAIRTRGGHRELLTGNRRGFAVLTGCPLAAELAEVRLLAWRLGLAGFGVLLLGLACGWWMATRAIQPITAISATARQIAAGNLDKRISVTETDNEFGQLAQVLNETFGRLQAAFARQAQFTADASHELRTPVSVVLSQTQMTLAKDRTADEYRACLAACQRAATRMRRLVESLLILARIDSGASGSVLDRSDLRQVAAECVDLLQPIAATQGVKLEADLHPAACRGDAGQLGQIVTNLVSNAIHYNRPGGTARVRVWEEKGSVRLVVSDTGLGIAPEDLPHIFQRFYRADKSRARAEGRTGLGLAITRALVEAHGGSITVQSEPGAGSTFTVQFPVGTEPKAANGVASDPPN